jgi:hypothetical protein
MSNAADIQRAVDAINDAVNPNPGARRTPADLVAGARAGVDAVLAPKVLDVNVQSMPAPAPKPKAKPKRRGA